MGDGRCPLRAIWCDYGGVTVGVAVVVTVHEDAVGLRRTLDDLLAQVGPPPDDVIVVDVSSEDGSAHLALHHPAVTVVDIHSRTPLWSAAEHGLDRVQRDRAVAFTTAATRLPGDWLVTGMDALASGADVVVGTAGGHADPSDLGPGDLFVSAAFGRRIGLGRVRTSPEAAEADLLAWAPRAGFRVATAAARRATAVNPPGPSVTADAPPRGGPTLSVAVCTDGKRTGQLQQCLASLAKLDDDVEVLVVENTSVARPPMGVPGLVARVVREPRLGLDVARNRAVGEASGDIVAFIDDDCEADPEWTRRLRVAFGDPEVSVVTGRTRPASLVQPSERWFEAAFSFDRGTAPWRHTQLDRDRARFASATGVLGSGCNMAFRRDVFLANLHFDEALDMGTPVGGGGDIDMFAQVLDAGLVVAYAPDALVWHHHRASIPDLRRQLFGYGVSIAAVCTKYAVPRTGSLWFYRDRLRQLRRAYRDARRGLDLFPPALLRTQIIGQLVGPVLYAYSRLRVRRTSPQ